MSLSRKDGSDFTTSQLSLNFLVTGKNLNIEVTKNKLYDGNKNGLKNVQKFLEQKY